MLVNASPDLPRQLELHLPPAPGETGRGSPLAGDVFLTNADLDHALGLLLLREGERLRVTAPDGVRRTLAEGLGWQAVLESACGVDWREAAPKWQRVAEGLLEFRAVPLPGARSPRFAPEVTGNHGVGYLFREAGNGPTLGIFPDVAELDAALLATLEDCAAVFFDGTFWRDDELKSLGFSPRTAREIGHVPMRDSLPRLAPLAARGVGIFYLHINNTNPALDPAAPERRELEAAGLRLAEDGQRLRL